jgi:hypothetical protein
MRQRHVVSLLVYALQLMSLILVALLLHFLSSYRRELGLGACFCGRSLSALRKRAL